MKEKNALRIRKLLPKSYVEKVERKLLNFLEIAVSFENGLLSEETAQTRMTEFLMKELEAGTMTKANASEFLELAQSPNCKGLYEFLNKKYKK